jgi:hypothetical protein
MGNSICRSYLLQLAFGAIFRTDKHVKRFAKKQARFSGGIAILSVMVVTAISDSLTGRPPLKEIQLPER